MRVAMILPSLERSGPGIHVEALSRALAKLGCYIEIFYLRDCKNKCLDFDFVECTQLTFNFEKIRKLSKFDVIHTHGFFPDLYGVLLSRLFIRTVHVSTMHNFIEHDIAGRYNGLKKKLYTCLWINVVKHVAHRVVFTDIGKQYYKSLVGGNVHKVGSGIDVNLVLRKMRNNESIDLKVLEVLSKFKKNKKIIGSTSIITEIKSLDIIVRALPQLPDYAAVFVGGGVLENDLIELASQLGVIDRCLFIGFVDNPISYLPYFDIYAMPSQSESFGLSLFEAIAAKLPVVCRDLPVFNELLLDVGLNKFDGSVYGFISAIKNISNNNSKSTEIAFQRLLNEYDIRKVAYKYYDFYQGVLN